MEELPCSVSVFKDKVPFISNVLLGSVVFIRT